ncbi:hypothetical protein A1O1_03010 [Capronia coronata CBS 617.96]|uniref:Rhodopsin domain-containing protein n=1 Tax=Capronia coronata CBS 617.96 TaxID=1182541 RepID=W9ZJD7_9EURO|nr:uncharacterized protein A1O1_03010 [Capronia coronata CBS 617.96]EXJ94614.1 hypothetical protein A1O1_03010 [Capronia coronata CBS 617.96]
MEPEKPLGVISPDNQSGLILILTALSLSFVVVSFIIRLYIRVPQRLWKWDDNTLTAATVLSCIQTSLVFYEVHIGLGDRKVVESNDEVGNRVKKYYYANDFLYLAVLVFSKAAVGCLFLRLTRQRAHIRAIWAILGSCAAWFVLSILLISIGSSWTRAYSLPFGRWLAVGITDALTELFLVLMAAFLVHGLRMSRVQKGTVVFAFGLRLLAIPALAIRLYYLNPTTLSDNRSLARSLVVVCTQIQLGYGIMAASVTVLKPFMVVYEKPTGSSNYTAGRSKQYGVGTNNSEHLSFKMKSLARSTEVGDNKRPAAGADPTQPYNSYNVTAAAAGHEKDDSIHSQDSRRLIIERKTDWSVRYEEAESHKSNVSEAGGSV